MYPDYDLIPQVARYQAALHLSAIKFAESRKIPENFIGGLLDYFISEAASTSISKVSKTRFWPEAKTIIDEIIEDVGGRLTKLNQLPHGLVHLDYDSDNILVTPSRVEGIIDFDDLSNLPFAVDLAYTLWWWAWTSRDKNSEQIVRKYMKYYQQGRRLRKNELSFLVLFMRLRSVAIGIILNAKKTKGITPAAAKQVIKFDQMIKRLRFK